MKTLALAALLALPTVIGAQQAVAGVIHSETAGRWELMAWDMLRDHMLAERYAIEEPECTDDLVQSGPGDARRHEVDLEGVDVV